MAPEWRVGLEVLQQQVVRQVYLNELFPFVFTLFTFGEESLFAYCSSMNCART